MGTDRATYRGKLAVITDASKGLLNDYAYILDDKYFEHLEAHKYLSECNFSLKERVQYLASLREEYRSKT